MADTEDSEILNFCEMSRPEVLMFGAKNEIYKLYEQTGCRKVNLIIMISSEMTEVLRMM